MLDFSRASRWRNLVRQVEVLTPGAAAGGQPAVCHLRRLGKTRTATSDVWVYDPPRRFGVKNTANNVTGVFEYTLERKAPARWCALRATFSRTA